MEPLRAAGGAGRGRDPLGEGRSPGGWASGSAPHPCDGDRAAFCPRCSFSPLPPISLSPLSPVPAAPRAPPSPLTARARRGAAAPPRGRGRGCSEPSPRCSPPLPRTEPS